LQSGDAARHVFHQFTVRTADRDALQAFLKEKGIASMVYYPVPLHKMKVSEGRMKAAGDLSHSEQAAREVLSLPIGPMQKEEDSVSVAEGVKQFFRRGSR
jgi:dTDP-4-amino-4,6-dideoxygalactose transaminase